MTSATIADSAAMPVAMPVSQAAGLIVDRNGRLHVSDGPFSGGKQITPSDSVDVTAPHRALYIGTGGTLSVVLLDADGVARNTVSTTVGDGSVFPSHVLRVNATGTGCSGIFAGW